MAEDYVDQMLKREEKRTGGTLKDARQTAGSAPLPRPKMPAGLNWIMEMGGKTDHMKPVSKAPAGMGNAVKGDLGMYRGMEADKVFRGHAIKAAGRTGACAKKLSYRKPAIEGGMGPHAI